jgi:hypothetical protein
MLVSLLITTLIKALGLMAGRLISVALFEKVLTDVFLYCGDKIAAWTHTSLDNQLMARFRAELLHGEAPQIGATVDYERAIQIAQERRDYFEAARLMNERDGLSK